MNESPVQQAVQAGDSEPEEKRKRGRPKGSKNKTKRAAKSGGPKLVITADEITRVGCNFFNNILAPSLGEHWRTDPARWDTFSESLAELLPKETSPWVGVAVGSAIIAAPPLFVEYQIYMAGGRAVLRAAGDTNGSGQGSESETSTEDSPADGGAPAYT